MADPITDWPTVLRALLAARGWTQARLAAEVGCHLGAVEHWVNGRRVPTGLYARALRRLLDAGEDAPR